MTKPRRKVALVLELLQMARGGQRMVSTGIGTSPSVVSDPPPGDRVLDTPR